MTPLALWRRQILTIVSLEWKKTLFARRGLWVFALAFLPALLIYLSALNLRNHRDELQRILLNNPTAAATTANIQIGMPFDRVSSILTGANLNFTTITRANRRTIIRYSDGVSSWDLIFVNGKLTDRTDRSLPALNDRIRQFAAIFQYFFLRLAIFFGCVGIFINLFRGEMLDQSLHHYLLAPVRRDVLLIGKYLSGLLSTILLFGSSTALQFFFLLYAYPGPESASYMATNGWSHFFNYLGVTALACVGYGSVFLASGIVLRNPLIPATIILFWEASNWFLPELLKKFSIIYYLQALCPVVAPISPDVPDAFKMLVTTTASIPTPLAILGILIISTAVLALAALSIRKLEINYSSD